MIPFQQKHKSKFNELKDKGLNLFKREKIFLFGNYSKQAASIIFTLYVAKQIDPINYGVLGIVTLLHTYSHLFSLGSNHIVNKELSVDIHDYRTYKFWLLSVAWFFIIIFVAAIIIKQINLVPEIHSYLVFVYLIVVFDFFHQSNMGILRAHLASNLLGYNNLAGAITTIAVVVFYFVSGIPNNPTPLIYKLFTVTTVQLIVSFFNLLFFKLSVKKILLAKLDYVFLKRMTLNGIALSAYNNIHQLYSSLDKLFILNYYGVTSLGYYTFAKTLIMPFETLIQSFTYLDFSKYLKALSKVCNLSDFMIIRRRMLTKYFFIWITVFLPALLGIFLILNIYFTNYKPSYFASILLLLLSFSRITNFANSTFLIANDKYKTLITGLLIAGFSYVLLAFGVVNMNLSFYALIIVNIIVIFFIYQGILLKQVKKQLQ